MFCAAVSPFGAVLLGCAVCSALLRVFLFPLKTIFRFLKKNYTLRNARMQAGSKTISGSLSYVLPCGLDVDGVVFVVFCLFPVFDLT